MNTLSDSFKIATSLEHIASPFKIHQKELYFNSSGEEIWKKVAGLAIFIIASLTVVWGLLLIATAAWKENKIYAISLKGDEKLLKSTSFILVKDIPPKASLTPNPLKNITTKLEHLGVAGLDTQISQIIHAINNQGSREILLYGPPGTGKSTLARNLWTVLGCKKENINCIFLSEYFNCPLYKMETNMQKLFKGVKKDHDKFGKTSPLHIIVIEDLDKQFPNLPRNFPLNKSYIGQLLFSATDVHLKNGNLIVIGIANSKDHVNPALLLPGRFDVQVEIGLPDKKARTKIIQLHCKTISELKYLHNDVDFDVLAELTEGYSGEDLEKMVKRATLLGLNRLLKLKVPKEELKNHPDGNIKMDDFEIALKGLEKEKTQPSIPPLSMYI